MEIKVLFFGVLQDFTRETSLYIKDIEDVSALRQEIERRHPEFADYYYQVSVNQVISNESTKLKDKDEVAFLPPFAGG